MSYNNNDRKRAFVRQALKYMPSASEDEVTLIMELDEQNAKNGESSFFNDPETALSFRQARLNSQNKNATYNSMTPNTQTSSIDPTILNEADRRMSRDRAYPEITANVLPQADRVDASGLTASNYLTNHLKKMEGYAPTVSNDGYNNFSGGYGHKQAFTPNWQRNMRVPFSQADKNLQYDILEAERTVRKMVRNLPLRQHEFDALVDLAFNVGATGLNATNSPDLHKAIKAGNHTAIGSELMYSLANDQKSQGLVNRSNSRFDLFSYGVYGRKYE